MIILPGSNPDPSSAEVDDVDVETVENEEEEEEDDEDIKQRSTEDEQKRFDTMARVSCI